MKYDTTKQLENPIVRSTLREHKPLLLRFTFWEIGLHCVHTGSISVMLDMHETDD